MTDSLFPIRNPQFLLCGKNEPEPNRTSLRAGPLSLIYEAGDLRYVKLGEREIVRRIYAALRDRNWGPVPANVLEAHVNAETDSFRINYTADHHQSEIHFVWHAKIVGERDGTIRFVFDGEARTTFLRNRIGFCILHPIRECAGVPCRVEYTDGRNVLTSFPKLIAAEQPIRDFNGLSAMAHEVIPGVWAEVRFDGDEFETEDQRNWIDASFKTFCTPLRIPFPVEIKAGARIQQTVTLRLLESPNSRLSILNSQPSASPTQEINQSLRTSVDPVEIVIQASQVRSLPAIGLGSPLDEDIRFRPKRMHKRLKALDLSHVRVDLRLNAHDRIAKLSQTLEWSDRLDLELEIALHLGKNAKGEMDELFSYPPLTRAKIGRFLIFERNAKSTSRELLEKVRRRINKFRPGIPIGAGTNADFYQLNEFRMGHELADFICWSMNPQVHAFDNASLAETPEAVAHQIESARTYFPGKPLVVSPITLRPRFNAVATGPEPPTPPGELPPQVDPRQMSLFGAGWTLAMVKHLAEAGVESVTFYETTGWRGVMETEAGSPLPGKFPSTPGVVFPIYHVLADFGDFTQGEVIVSKSSDPLKIESLVLRKHKRAAVLLANLTGQPQRASVHGLNGPVSVRRLDQTNAERAMTEPEKFRAEANETIKVEQGHLEVKLKPYALTRIDSVL